MSALRGQIKLPVIRPPFFVARVPTRSLCSLFVAVVRCPSGERTTFPEYANGQRVGTLATENEGRMTGSLGRNTRNENWRTDDAQTVHRQLADGAAYWGAELRKSGSLDFARDDNEELN